MNFDVNWVQILYFIVAVWMFTFCVCLLGSAFAFIFIGPKKIYKAIKSLEDLENAIMNTRDKKNQLDYEMTNNQIKHNRELELMGLHMTQIRTEFTYMKLLIESKNKNKSNIPDKKVDEKINKWNKDKETNRKVKNVVGNIIDIDENCEITVDTFDEEIIENKDTESVPFLETKKYMNLVDNQLGNRNNLNIEDKIEIIGQDKDYINGQIKYDEEIKFYEKLHQ